MNLAGELRTICLPSAAWHAACSAALGESALTDEHAAPLEQIGWLTPFGDLSPQAAQLLKQHLQPDIAFRIVAQYRDLAHICDLSVGADVTTSSLAQFRVGPRQADGETLTGANPDIEFLLALDVEPWQVIRRMLPPVEEFTADPQQTPPDQIEQITLDDATAEQVRSLVSAGEATPERLSKIATGEALSILQPDAAVRVSMRLNFAGRTGLTVSNWIRGASGGLYLIHEVEGKPRIDRMRPGQLGFEVVWLTLGALQTTGRAR